MAMVEPESAHDDPHENGQDRESAPQLAKPLIQYVDRFQTESRVKYQSSHEDEKRHRKERESGDGREDSYDCSDEAGDPTQKEIGGDQVDNEKGKGNGYAGEQEKDHSAEEQGYNRVPFHVLPALFTAGDPRPRHSEELERK